LRSSTVGIGFHGETEKKEKGRGSTHRFYIVVENESEDNDWYDEESVIMSRLFQCSCRAPPLRTRLFCGGNPVEVENRLSRYRAVGSEVDS